MAQELGWDDVESLAGVLAGRLRRLPGFDAIATPGRGGLVPSRLLADRLGIRRILVDPPRAPRGALYVDDIYDSGATFGRVLAGAEDPGGLVFAALLARRGAARPPQLVCAGETADGSYVVFPWDRFEHASRSVSS